MFILKKPNIVIVEPTKAPVLQESINAGKATTVTGGVSNMGRLDCKSPSLKALSSLAITCTHFITIEDEDAETDDNTLCFKKSEVEITDEHTR